MSKKRFDLHPFIQAKIYFYTELLNFGELLDLSCYTGTYKYFYFYFIALGRSTSVTDQTSALPSANLISSVSTCLCRTLTMQYNLCTYPLVSYVLPSTIVEAFSKDCSMDLNSRVRKRHNKQPVRSRLIKLHNYTLGSRL